MLDSIRKQAAEAFDNGYNAVVGIREINGHAGPYIFTDKSELEHLAAAPRVNLSRILQKLQDQKPEWKVAAVLRGCDGRALRKLKDKGLAEPGLVRAIPVTCSKEQAAECNCEKPFYETFDCTGCWECIEACPVHAIERTNVCPIVVPSEWNVGTTMRKATYIAFPQAVPMKALRDKDHCLRIKGDMECKGCENACEAKAINHDQQDEVRELDVGSIIVATGFDVLDPEPIHHFGYGKYSNVLTNFEFERLSNATGPTSGAIRMRDSEDRLKFTTPPESVAILHCIGSRDKNYHSYCSRACCMYALKFAHLIKDKVGEHVQVFNFYIDMRCFGKGYEEFLNKVQSEGVRMVRGKAVEVTDRTRADEEPGKLVVVAEDTLLNKKLRVPVDMVILCTAMEARKDAGDVARMFNISMDANGFFMEEHPKLAPVSTPSSGVFIAGACHGPKDIPDSVAQAKGAASEAIQLSAFGSIVSNPMVSSIDADVCIGCKTCIGLCPYSAITFDEQRGVSVVGEAICKGCGSCAAHCPSGAARIRHFSPKQILCEVDGIFAEPRNGAPKTAKKQPAHSG
jgi:heterodisulfide reductase subunit A